ncbi:MAG: 3-phosphoshikimate 1-carboxyvinyltransferase [Turicibacter sp.]
MSLNGTIKVASDKSITHRAIIFSSLSEGKTRILNPLMGEDCISTLRIFEQLGVESTIKDDELIIKSPGSKQFTTEEITLDAGNSGTTARLLMGVFSGLPLCVNMHGDESLSKRPMKRVTAPLDLMGARIELTPQNTLPATISGRELKAIDYTLPVASAQVKSAIMLAALNAQGQTTIHEPILTRNHTEKMFEAFQIAYNKENHVIVINGNQTPVTPGVIKVPGDISSAAFFMVAALLVNGSQLTLEEVGLNESRSGIVDVIVAMGGQLTISDRKVYGGEAVGTIHLTYTKDLKPMVIEGDMIPRLIDEIPIIALLAAFADGTTVIKDAQELKVKETNRIDVTVAQLSKIGIHIEATADGMLIHGNPNQNILFNTVSSHGDHRIAMMLCVASLLSEVPLEINHIEAMNVSYPGFLKDLEELTKK